VSPNQKGTPIMAGKRLGWSIWKRAFAPAAHRKTYLHLERANDRGVCFCTCERALAAVPDQMDCPWCGCGWLFSCASCGKAFTYAKPVRIAHPLRELVEWDLVGRGIKKSNRSFIKSGAEWMEILLKDVEGEDEHVYFDGYFVPLAAKNTTIEGHYANHKVKALPHAQELKKPGSLAALENPSYWTRRERPDRD
jgi:hypothetical protein